MRRIAFHSRRRFRRTGDMAGPAAGSSQSRMAKNGRGEWADIGDKGSALDYVAPVGSCSFVGDDMNKSGLRALSISFGMLVIGSNAVTAGDVSIDDLLGDWCGAKVDYSFTRTKLNVKLHGSGNLTHGPVLEIEKVENGDGWVNIIWKGAGNTIFLKFSADGREMFQKANNSGDMGPELRFHRC
jgi:hypothetical protein